MMMSPKLAEDIGTEQQRRRIRLTAIFKRLECAQRVAQPVVSVEAEGGLQETVRVRFLRQ
jgi:hypothetical protein